MKRISIVLVLAALATALVLTGCPQPTSSQNGVSGSNGVNAPNIVSSEAGIRAAFADGYDIVHLVGAVDLRGWLDRGGGPDAGGYQHRRHRGALERKRHGQAHRGGRGRPS